MTSRDQHVELKVIAAATTFSARQGGGGGKSCSHGGPRPAGESRVRIRKLMTEDRKLQIGGSKGRRKCGVYRNTSAKTPAIGWPFVSMGISARFKRTIAA